MTDLVIIGAGGLGREVLAIARALNEVHRKHSDNWNMLGFLDSNPELLGADVDGIPVLGGDEWCTKHSSESVRYVCAIGNPQTRREVVQKLSAMRCKFTSLVHPDVAIPGNVELGTGTVIMAGTRFSTRARIGSHVVIYLNCAITHDVVIGDYALVTSGCNLSGGAVIETGAELGCGANVLPLKQIGEWSVIGAGSVVTEDIPANSIAVGVPCRVIKNRSAGS